jgi:phage terminase small subunit
MFAEEFVLNGRNATRAAIAVGYAPYSAGVTGSRLLKNADVRAIVCEAEERALGKARLSTERVLRELERAIFADPRKLYDERGRLKPIHALDDDTAGAIASIDMDDLTMGRGPKHTAKGVTAKVRFVDKLVAIDRAMKHLGLFERDKGQRDSNIVIQVNLVSSPQRLVDSEQNWRLNTHL